MEKSQIGFISMTLVYTFLVVFLFLMVAILAAYTEKDKYLETIDGKISEDIGYNKSERKTILNTIIANNNPVSIDVFDGEKSNIVLFGIASSSAGNGNGLFYSTDSSIVSETPTSPGSNAPTNRIYFFRGSTENNHLIFADKCWRIVRSNQDGSIRIRYNGEPDANLACPNLQKVISNATGGKLAAIGKAKYNSTNTQEADLKYINTSVENGSISDITRKIDIKEMLDQWYINNLKKYSDLISTSGFCNDASVVEGMIPTYSNSNSHNVYNRDDWKNTVTLACNNKDMYTPVIENYGNKLLNYPIGLLSAAEIILAGGYITDAGSYLDLGLDKYKGGINGMANENFYLYTNSSFWTMSPFKYADKSGTNRATAIYFHKNGYMMNALVNNSYDVIPVISLRASAVVAAGSGTARRPYIVY